MVDAIRRSHKCALFVRPHPRVYLTLSSSSDRMACKVKSWLSHFCVGGGLHHGEFVLAHRQGVEPMLEGSALRHWLPPLLLLGTLLSDTASRRTAPHSRAGS